MKLKGLKIMPVWKERVWERWEERWKRWVETEKDGWGEGSEGSEDPAA